MAWKVLRQDEHSRNNRAKILFGKCLYSSAKTSEESLLRLSNIVNNTTNLKFWFEVFLNHNDRVHSWPKPSSRIILARTGISTSSAAVALIVSNPNERTVYEDSHNHCEPQQARDSGETRSFWLTLPMLQPKKSLLARHDNLSLYNNIAQ